MKAAVITNKNEPLVIQDLELPLNSSDEVSVRVHFSGLNHRDVWISKGLYAGLRYPIVVGSDLCGEFNGNEVIVNPAFYWGSDEKFQGSRFEILGLPRNGALAEWTSVPVNYIYTKPKHLSGAEAAVIPLAGLTAYRALVSRGKAIQGENLLVTGIGGGVALFVLQFACALGLNVFVSSSSDDKITKAIQLGAKAGFNYLNPDWDKQCLADGLQFDIIVDGAAGSDFNKLVKVAKPGARIVIYGGTKGLLNNLVPQQIFWKQINILGSTMGSDLDFKNMLELINDHKLIPVVDSVFPLSKVNDAFIRMEQGLQFGKIVVSLL